MSSRNMKSESYMSDKLRADMLNPFVHKLEIENTYDKIKTALLTVVLLPFRVIVICVLIVSAWFLACLGLFGMSEADLRAKPMTGWRRNLRCAILTIMKLVVMTAGFHNVKILGRRHLVTNSRDAPVMVMAPHSTFFDAIAIVSLGAPSVVAKADTARIPFIGPGGMAITVRGRQATRAEAPILVVAPHSSFLDSCIVYATQMSTVIVRKESMDNYVGKLINYTQPVYVWRDDPNSRQNTIKEIISRSTSKQDWPQILIFPEGTCTNRSCLITFKPGGFYPGVPVQPVTIRYPNALDTVTWTWEGPGALKLLWLTLTQLHSSCEIEFLPVYYPNEEEKQNPKLYARNVRDVMARALNIPVMDYTYDDCRLIARAKQLGVPCAADAVRIHELRQILGLENSRLELHLAAKYDKDRPQWLTLEQFAKALGVACDERSGGLFHIFKQPNTELVYWPDYLLCAVFLTLQNTPLEQIIHYAFKIYDESGTGRVNAGIFERIATRCLGLHQEDAYHVFRQVDLDEKGYIHYDEFVAFAQKKAEFAFVFSSDGVHEKKKSV